MKRIYVYAALALAVLPASCAKEVPESEGIAVVNPNPPERRVNFLSFKASLEDRYKTKTAIDLDVTHKVIWERDDEVLIEDAAGKQAVYKAVTGGRDTTTLVRVSGDTLAVGSTYKAWYPASYKDMGLPSVVYYDDVSTFRGAPMYAEGMGKLDFHPECGVVRFSYNPLSRQIVKNISVSSDIPVSKEGAVLMDITKNYPNGRTLEPTSRNEFAFNMLPGEYTNINVKFINVKDTLVDVTLLYSLKVTAGTIVDVDLNNPEGREVNLSRLGTANCYLVTHSGDFYFTPTKGCSNAPVGDIASVEVLWETDNNTTAIAKSSVEKLSYESGRIYFSVPDDYTPSNALVAAKDNGGNILWSWHIWICNGPVSVNKYDHAGKLVLLDRCLGTLAGYDSKLSTKYMYAVLLYQWGRKDPFPGCTVNGTSGVRPLIVPAGEKTSVQAGPVSQGTAAANPTVFYTDELDWLSESSDTLWAADHKTILDPCPVGYMIAPMSAYSDEEGDFYQGWVKGYYGNNSGIYAGQNKIEGNGDVYAYPLTNHLVGATGAINEKASAQHLVWTTEITGASQPLAAKLFWNSGKVDLATDEPFLKSDGLSVRCMLISE